MNKWRRNKQIVDIGKNDGHWDPRKLELTNSLMKRDVHQKASGFTHQSGNTLLDLTTCQICKSECSALLKAPTLVGKLLLPGNHVELYIAQVWISNKATITFTSASIT